MMYSVSSHELVPEQLARGYRTISQVRNDQNVSLEDIEIRQAVYSDIPGLISFTHLVHMDQNSKKYFPSSFPSAISEHIVALRNNDKEEQGSSIFCAILNRSVIGWMLASRFGHNQVRWDWDYVLPHFRYQAAAIPLRVGARLYREREIWSLNQGYTNAEIFIHEANPILTSLHLQRGADHVGSQAGFVFANGSSGVVKRFRKNLIGLTNH